LEVIMRRNSRNAPLWIVVGASVVILAATLSSNARSGSSTKAADDEIAARIASPQEPESEKPALEPARGESRQMTPAPAKLAPFSMDPVGTAGMVVGIDPETGKLGMPSREFRDALRESQGDPAVSRSMEGLEVIHRPDGSKMIDLKDRFQDYAVVRITPDGRKEQDCVQGPDIERALQNPAATETAATATDPVATESATSESADNESVTPSADPTEAETASESLER
jgi:hypothetical protein